MPQFTKEEWEMRKLLHSSLQGVIDRMRAGANNLVHHTRCTEKVLNEANTLAAGSPQYDDTGEKAIVLSTTNDPVKTMTIILASYIVGGMTEEQILQFLGHFNIIPQENDEENEDGESQDNQGATEGEGASEETNTPEGQGDEAGSEAGDQEQPDRSGQAAEGDPGQAEGTGHST